MFLAGNKEKNKKLSTENTLRNLQLYAENNEIESDNIPSPQQIKYGYLDLISFIKGKQQISNNVKNFIIKIASLIMLK